MMAISTPPRAIIGSPHRPCRRGVDNAVLGGVCGGLAIRLGIKERTIRILFALLALVSGIGLLLYMLLWLTLARSGEDHTIAHRLVAKRPPLRQTLIGSALVSIFIGFFFLLGGLNIGVYTWPLLFSGAAAIVVWAGSSLDERRHLQDLVKSLPLIRIPKTHNRTVFWIRIVLGALLVLIGLRTLSRIHGVWGGVTPELVGTLIVIAGALTLLAPWWLETLSELSGERRARVRVEERANVAAHLHDSVLQTLTLIERAAADEAAVIRLARNQERELRQWLFEPEKSAAASDNGTLSSQLHVIEAEIENDYGVKIELVVVGDCDATSDVLALVAAGREATINAAQWSGAQTISVFAEVETGTISLFVRDQGKGFDTDSVPDDRKGIALSIRQRMTRHGGFTTLRSSLGTGTEVQLNLPRTQ
jgi:signal transduction histidine kinase